MVPSGLLSGVPLIVRAVAVSGKNVGTVNNIYAGYIQDIWLLNGSA